jgi:ribosomal protein S18 acetylase RimI-like enzyme
MTEPALFSTLDSRRFGIRIFRGQVDTVAAAAQLMDFAHAQPLDLLIVRCPSKAVEVAQALERAGYFLTDTLVYYRGETHPFEPFPAPATRIRPFQFEDRAALEKVATAAFQGFRGHYHADSRLDPTLATAGYAEWAISAVSDPSCVVLVSETDRQLSGFLTAKKLDGNTWEILLNGVAPEFQRRGIYTALFNEIGVQAAKAGASTLQVSTQLTNLAPQKVWIGCGLELERAQYTFHWWKG